MITEEQLKDNPKMAALIAKAMAKDRKVHFSVLTPEMIASKNGYQFDNTSYNKYGVSDKEDRTYKDGTVFASKREMERWDYLLNIQRSGQITDLKSQVPFVLQESFISEQWGKLHELLYVADFTYINITFRKGYEGRFVVEDSKGGLLTQVYKIKKKLFLYKYGEYLFFEV